MTAESRLLEMVAATGPKVVTAGEPAAAAAGAGAYAAGGNAFDAALAACFMEQITLPMKCGLFGDLVALYRREGGAFQALVSVGPGARALASGATLERIGPRSVGVPGAPDGYVHLHAMARKGLSELAAPAIRAATQGVPWTRLALSYVHEARNTLERLSPRNPYLRGGVAPSVGDTRILPGLGELLQAFVERGAALYDEEIGAAIVSELQARGGILTVEDLRQRPACTLQPLQGKLGASVALTVTPPPTHGNRLIEVVCESLRSSVSLPTLVRNDRAEAKRRGRLPSDGGTSVITAADDEGNAVVVLHSNSYPQFASGIVLDSGLILNNRPGRGFDLEAPAEAVNAPRAGCVPMTTLHAWALTRGSDLTIGATPGGVNQLPWNVQAVRNLVEGASIAEAVMRPRWALDASDVLTSEPDAETGGVEVSSVVAPLTHRSAQQMIRLSADGLHVAAADPRAGATAIAVY